jgi:Cu-processing system permease protein
MFQTTFAIAHATFLSLLRNRFTVFLISLVVLFTLLCLAMSTVNIGIRFRLFENLILSSQTFLLYGVAWLYGFDILRRDQQELLFMLPLSTGMSRRAYYSGRFWGLVALILLIGFSFVVINIVLIAYLEHAIVWPIIFQTVITIFGAILSAAILMCFGVNLSAFSAVIYSILMWFIGHGLDELVLFSEKQLNPSLHSITQMLYSTLPNFSLTDLSSIALNRLPNSAIDWLFPVFYCSIYSALLIALACLLYEKKSLAGND